MTIKFDVSDLHTQPDRQFLLRERIFRLGFESTMALFASYAAENLDELAQRLSVDAEELRLNFLCEAFERDQVRLYSIELLVRMLWSVPGGWQKRKSGRVGAGTVRQLRDWMSSPALMWHGFEVATSSIVREMLKAKDIQRGWQPQSSSDPQLLALFDRHWHDSTTN